MILEAFFCLRLISGFDSGLDFPSFMADQLGPDQELFSGAAYLTQAAADLCTCTSLYRWRLEPIL